ncbi:MAG: M3 family metallopeptidase, partial [Gammaproteobacteria bacterium]|nr:M3 family metallopeptidase [Gammaproteobacteria bacterium]
MNDSLASNPIFNNRGLPTFSQIKPEHVEPAIDEILRLSRIKVNELLDATQAYTWENLIEPLERLDEWVGRAWSPVSHMNSVVNSDELRQAYNACIPKLSEFSTEMGQNERLFNAYKTIEASAAYQNFSVAQKKIIDNSLRDFRLSGVELTADKKDHYKEIMQQLSNLHSKFEENILDATNAWKKVIEDESLLSGLPESVMGLAKQTAQREEHEGWMLNLEFPLYYPVMCYCDNRELRAEMYAAYVTRASDEGPNAGQWDNTQLMQDILRLRHESAVLLGFHNYAEKSLATKMATHTDQVMAFLNDLAVKSIAVAHAELKELKAFAKEHFEVDELESWDVAYYSEKLRQHKYAITQEELKPYFPEDRVLQGMF